MPIEHSSMHYAKKISEIIKKDSPLRGVPIHLLDIKEVLDRFNAQVTGAMKKRMVLNLRYFILFPFPTDKRRRKGLSADNKIQV